MKCAGCAIRAVHELWELYEEYELYRRVLLNSCEVYESHEVFFVSFLCSHPIQYFRPPSRNSDPGSHTRHLSPLPATVHALRFYRDGGPALFLPSSTRV